MIRRADIEADAAAIMDGARDFVSRIDYPECVAEGDDLVEAVAKVVSLPGFECWVDERDGKIVGGIGLLFSPPVWKPRELGMSELFIWAAKDAPTTTFLRLMRCAEKRRREMGAAQRQFEQLPSSPPGIERIYRAMGLRRVQTTWIGVD